MKNKKSDKLCFIAVGILLIVIVVLLIIKSTYKPKDDKISITGTNDYVSTKIVDSKINISTSNYSFKLTGYEGKIEDIVTIAGCAFDDNYNLVTVLTTDGLYALYVGNSYIYDNIDKSLKLVKISDRKKIKKMYYKVVGDENSMTYDNLGCFRYPFIEYKNGDIKALDPGTTDVTKMLTDKEDYQLINIK